MNGGLYDIPRSNTYRGVELIERPEKPRSPSKGRERGVGVETAFESHYGVAYTFLTLWSFGANNEKLCPLSEKIRNSYIQV